MRAVFVFFVCIAQYRLRRFAAGMHMHPQRRERWLWFRCKQEREQTKMGVTRFSGIRACVFDAYGTLFDYASAAARCRDVLGDQHERLTALWREKQLQYTWLRALQSRHANFWQVTGDALDFAMETVGIDDRALRGRLMELYLTLETFPEVPEMLARLKAKGLATAILSNGSPDMLKAAVEDAKIGGLDRKSTR